MAINNFQTLPGRVVVGPDGQKIGNAGEVFVDDRTGHPEWLTVNTGLFGMRHSFVPLQDAELRGEEIVVPYDKETVKGAPNIDVGSGHLSPGEEEQLYRHYGRDYAEPGRSDGTDDAMTRSEEQLRVGTERVETGRARLRKYVDTEDVQVNVPLRRERVVVEREPITDANRGDAYIGEDEQEVTTYEERAVVDKEAVPVERVRLTTETETDEETVSGTVRKERIEEEGTDPGARY